MEGGGCGARNTSVVGSAEDFVFEGDLGLS